MSRLSPYKRVDDQDVEEGNFVMNPYVSKHSSKAKSKLSVSDATMYPAAEISTYKSKSKNRGTSGLKM